ncbi:MAG TPA: hypothetical protein VKS79_03705 [Gemmataceae bacterium]|nr:hypothetical protein [Gemmataceae bacterium]
MSEIKRNRRWLWVFVVLGILGLLAMGINYAYNVGEPLTLEKLNAARALWAQKRPINYDLHIVFSREYVSDDGRRGTLVDQFQVEVRDGKVTGFLVNGKEPEPLLDAQGQRRLEDERLRRANYDISGIFDSIEDLMNKDRREGNPTFLRARFDPNDGHITLFTRQIHRRREQYIQVAMKKV